MSELDDIIDVGDLVVWEIKQRGKTHHRIGEVVLWIGPRKQLRMAIPQDYHDTYDFNSVEDLSRMRDQESYLIASMQTSGRRPSVFWPHAHNLIKIGPFTLTARLCGGGRTATISSLSELHEATLCAGGRKRYTHTSRQIANAVWGVISGAPVRDLIYDVQVDFFARPNLASKKLIETKIRRGRLTDDVITSPVFPVGLPGEQTPPSVRHKIAGVD